MNTPITVGIVLSALVTWIALSFVLGCIGLWWGFVGPPNWWTKIKNRKQKSIDSGFTKLGL